MNRNIEATITEGISRIAVALSDLLPLTRSRVGASENAFPSAGADVEGLSVWARWVAHFYYGDDWGGVLVHESVILGG